MTSSAIPYLKILYSIHTWGLPPRLGPPPSKSGAESNSCSTTAPRSWAAKQWLLELHMAQKIKKQIISGVASQDDSNLQFLFCWIMKRQPVTYAENLYGGFIQWHMLVVCIWCALFVTSQFEVIFMFPNECLAKFVDIICIFFYARSP